MTFIFAYCDGGDFREMSYGMKTPKLLGRLTIQTRNSLTENGHSQTRQRKSRGEKHKHLSLIQ